MKSICRHLSGILVMLLFICTRVSGQAPVYDVKKYGAKGDGKKLDTKAIDKAIDAAAAAGGGTVWFPAGNYLSVTIHLKSNVSLYIDQGATIVAADAGDGVQYDFPEKADNDLYQDYGHSYFRNSVIYGENLHDIAITGPGHIWGKGLMMKEGANGNNPPGLGNKTLSLKLCRNVILKDFTIAHGGWFGFLLTGVDNMTIDNIKMDTNRDGIDLVSSKNVRISNCTINSPVDDAIVLKSDYALNYPRDVENVSITNCQVSGYKEGTLLDGTNVKWSNGSPTGRIKLGTESNGGFKNIAISNCVLKKASVSVMGKKNRPANLKADSISAEAGIALEAVDGGLMDQIVINNISMFGVQTPIFIKLGNRKYEPANAGNIIISNVTATSNSLIASSITGIPGYDVENVVLRDILITCAGGGTEKDAATTYIIENKGGYPANNMFGNRLPAYGFFIRHANNIELHNVRFTLLSHDARPEIYQFDVKNLKIE